VCNDTPVFMTYDNFSVYLGGPNTAYSQFTISICNQFNAVFNAVVKYSLQISSSLIIPKSITPDGFNLC